MIIPNRKPKHKAPRSAKRSVMQYAKQLRQIATVVEQILKDGIDAKQAWNYLVKRLQSYGESLTGWAFKTAAHMLHEVDSRDKQQWLARSDHLSRKQQKKIRERLAPSVIPSLPQKPEKPEKQPNQVIAKPNKVYAEHSAASSKIISSELQSEIKSAPTGDLMRSLLNEQVTLIKSLPLKAAEKVHELTLAGIINSKRAADISQEVLKLGNITKNRANLIARTEVARTASLLTQARAQHLGCETYIWRTSGDSDVRSSHKAMNGQTVRWDSPPQLSDGMTTHAGQIYNCRCWAEPIIPD